MFGRRRQRQISTRPQPLGSPELTTRAQLPPAEPLRQPRRPGRPKAAYISVLLVIIVGILVGLHFQPKKHPVTELYFDPSPEIPATYTPGAPQSFSFSIHNLEYRSMAYPYIVSAMTGGSGVTSQLTTGTLHLDQNDVSTTRITITMPNLGQRVRVNVILPSVNEAIDYWVDRNP